MAATSQITVTSVADTAVIAASYCKNVYIRQNVQVANWPTTAFLVKKVLDSSSVGATTPISLNSGEEYKFSCADVFYVPGQIVGYVRTASGTTTFDQDEDQVYGLGAGARSVP